MGDGLVTTRCQAPAEIDIDGRTAPLVVRRNKNARRLLLRVQSSDGCVVVTLPQRVPVAEGLRFLQANQAWIAARLAALPPALALADGAILPFRGVPHPVRHRPDARRGVWIEDGAIQVSGAAEHLPRRLRDFLVKEARAEFTARSHALAQRIGGRIAKVAVRDARSRWGSCSTDGELMFSWRVILAPDFVRHYLVAHEVAHLRHGHHGPSFWRLVHELAPETESAKAWLHREGAALQPASLIGKKPT